MNQKLDAARAVPVRTLKTEHSSPATCFRNVAKQVNSFGGQMRLGWLAATTLFPEVPFIQVWIHHAVWQSPEGEIFDISPQLGLEEGSTFFVEHFPESVHFIPDDTATLLDLGNGHFKSRPVSYAPLRHEEKVLRAIQCLVTADKKLSAGDLRGEAYWAQKAAKILGGWIEPFGEAGLKIMQPFSFD